MAASSLRPIGTSRWRLCIALCAVLLLASGCLTVNIGDGGRDAFEESVVFGQGGPKVLMLEVEGVISEHERPGFFGPGSESTVARIIEQLDRARAEGDIEALLLRIDTPGGSASASDDVYRAIEAFKAEAGIPVVAQLMGIATSGGYYVAMSADEVRAAPTTVTGSIGVLFMGLSLEGLMERWGVRDQTVTGGVHKDAGSFLRDMTPEEEAIMQSVVDDLHDRFKAVVQAGRPDLDMAAIDRLADGRVYSAPQAVEAGLVDAIASLEETAEHAAGLAGIEGSFRVVTYHRPTEYRNNLHTRADVPAPEASGAPDWAVLAEKLGLAGLDRAGFHYLWLPAAR